MCKIDISTNPEEIECVNVYGSSCENYKHEKCIIYSFRPLSLALAIIFASKVLIVIALKWFYMNVLGIIYTRTHLTYLVHSWEMILNAFISLTHEWRMNEPKSVMLKLNIILNSFGIIRYVSRACVCMLLLEYCWPTHGTSLLWLLILTNDGKFSEKKAIMKYRRKNEGWMSG